LNIVIPAIAVPMLIFLMQHWVQKNYLRHFLFWIPMFQVWGCAGILQRPEC